MATIVRRSAASTTTPPDRIVLVVRFFCNATGWTVERGGEWRKWETWMKILILTLLLLLPLTVSASEITHKLQQGELKNKLFYLKDGNIWYQDPNQEMGQQLTTKGGISTYSISRDSSLVLLTKGDKIYLLDPITGTQKYLTTANLDVTTPSISPTNDKIAYISQSKKKFPHSKYLKETRRHIWLLDIKSMKSTDITAEENTEFSDVKWSPDGTHLSFHSFRDKEWKYYILKIGEPVSNPKVIGNVDQVLWLDPKSVLVRHQEGLTINMIFDWIDITTGGIFKTYKGQLPCGKFEYLPPHFLVCEDGEFPDEDKISIIDMDTGVRKLIANDAKSPVFIK